MNTDKKIALITGSSRGIGRAIAIELARNGFFVIVNYREDKTGARNVLDEIHSSGADGICCCFDVADRHEAEKTIKSLSKELGTIGVLVNNAGIIRDQPIVRMRDEDWDVIIATNLTGVYNCSKAVVRTWAGRKKGSRIVNIASIVGEMGNAYQTNYAASKGGIISFTKALALELAPKKVTVNAVAPGFILTDQVLNLSIDRLEEKIPLNRIGTPEEVAHAVSFLVSEGAGYITGQIIRVNGGLYM